MMRFCSALLLWILLPVLGIAQLSDFISVQKKNGRIIRNYGVGSPINFLTPAGMPIEGIITHLRNDSIFLRSMNVRQFGTSYGGIILDTMTYFSAWSFKDIARVKMMRYRGLAYNRASALMMIGGAGYFILNAVNGVYRGEDLGNKDYLITLAGSAAVFGAGYLLRKRSPDNYTRKSHRIKYINMQ